MLFVPGATDVADLRAGLSGGDSREVAGRRGEERQESSCLSFELAKRLELGDAGAVAFKRCWDLCPGFLWPRVGCGMVWAIDCETP